MKMWCMFSVQMQKGCRNDLNKFYTLYLQKGVFVKFAILSFIVLIWFGALLLFSIAHSHFSHDHHCCTPHYHSLRPKYVVHFCANALLCTQRTHLSPLLKCYFQYSNLKFRCATIYPFAQWRKKMKWNRKSFYRLQKKCHSKFVYAKAPLRRNRANSSQTVCYAHTLFIYLYI